MSLEQKVTELVTAVDSLTNVVSDKIGDIDQTVQNARQAFNTFISQSDQRYVLQKRITQTLRVDGDQNYWYPVSISQPDGASFYLRRYTHDDQDTFGKWNGSLEFTFRGNDSNWGGFYPYFLVDTYLSGQKGDSRILPDADIPFIGQVSVSHSPYELWIWLRGNTTYRLGSEYAETDFKVYYEEVDTQGGYAKPKPIAVKDGVHASVPSVGYIRG